jgi:prepilin-type N-terminal cleavage/methylation domain-containing protein
MVMKRKHTGFTLIELLVVIVVMGILITIGLMSYANIGKNARDTKRRDDLDNLQKEFELYYNSNGSYPAPVGMTPSDCLTTLKTSIATATKPVDPDTGDDYYWKCSAQSYCICTGALEVQKGNASNTTCTFQIAGTNYCVRNIQTLDVP